MKSESPGQHSLQGLSLGDNQACSFWWFSISIFPWLSLPHISVSSSLLSLIQTLVIGFRTHLHNPRYLISWILWGPPFNSLQSSCILNGSLRHVWFHNSALVTWKILLYWLMQIFQMLTHLIALLKKITFANITNGVHQKILSAQGSSQAETNFPKL